MSVAVDALRVVVVEANLHGGPVCVVVHMVNFIGLLLIRDSMSWVESPRAILDGGHDDRSFRGRPEESLEPENSADEPRATVIIVKGAMGVNSTGNRPPLGMFRSDNLY